MYYKCITDLLKMSSTITLENVFDPLRFEETKKFLTLPTSTQTLNELLNTPFDGQDKEFDKEVEEEEDKYLYLQICYRGEEVRNGDKPYVLAETVRIFYDYPLNNFVTFTHTAKRSINNGDGKEQKYFTVHDFVDCIKRDYARIYREEEKGLQQKGKDVPRVASNCLNRSTTNGKYGIWGHDIGDLVLEGVYFDTEKNKFYLSIGS